MRILRLFIFFCCICVSFIEQGALAESGVSTGMDLYRAASIVIKRTQGVDVTVEESAVMLLGLGYVSGFNDGIVLGTLDGPKAFSLPADGIENEQVMLIVYKYLTDHPEIMHESARVCLYQALAAAFPVKKST